jgi:hypothetical protein
MVHMQAMRRIWDDFQRVQHDGFSEIVTVFRNGRMMNAASNLKLSRK